MAYYAIWDTESNNLIAETGTEDEALGIVRDLLEANAPDYAEFLSLARIESPLVGEHIAHGADLADRARRSQSIAG